MTYLKLSYKGELNQFSSYCKILKPIFLNLDLKKKFLIIFVGGSPNFASVKGVTLVLPQMKNLQFGIRGVINPPKQTHLKIHCIYR